VQLRTTSQSSSLYVIHSTNIPAGRYRLMHAQGKSSCESSYIDPPLIATAISVRKEIFGTLVNERNYITSDRQEGTTRFDELSHVILCHAPKIFNESLKLSC
jgi:hypothetical protein